MTALGTRKLNRRPAVEILEDRVVPTLLGNQLFPSDNPWNQYIANAPADLNSNTLVNSIGANSHVHPDFGAGMWQGANIGIPFNVVSGNQPKITVVIDAYEDQSDVVPIPIPAGVVLEGDPAAAPGDRHMLVYDKDNNILYETFNTKRPSETADGMWHADSEAVWDLNVNSFRPPTWTSADAAGLPILPGLVRPDEVYDQGKIEHAIRFTVPSSRNAFIYPASHQAGSNNSSLPRMGERFRLKASFDISGFSPANRVILQAMKDYGLIVADNGSGWYISGEPSPRWNDDELNELKTLIGSNFEAVDLTPIVSGLDTTSGPGTGGTTVTITGLNFSGGAGLTQVFFGTTASTSVTVNSDGSITAVSPAHAAGTVDVTVQSPYGTSALVAADRFTYTSGSGGQPGAFRFSTATYSVNENGGTATITVTRTGGSTGAVSVQYATSNGTATAGVDYTSAASTLQFAEGQTSRTFTVTIREDTLVEGNETVNLTLSNPGGGATLGSPATATLTIIDNDTNPPPPPPVPPPIPNPLPASPVQVSVERGKVRRNPRTNRYRQTVTLRNVGAAALRGPVSLVLDGLRAGVRLRNPTGVTTSAAPLGSPYVNVVASGGVLGPGGAVTLTLEFTNPKRRAIGYVARVMAGDGGLTVESR